MNNVCKNSHKNDTANIQSLKYDRKQVEKNINVYSRTNKFSLINLCPHIHKRKFRQFLKDVGTYGISRFDM